MNQERICDWLFTKSGEVEIGYDWLEERWGRFDLRPETLNGHIPVLVSLWHRLGTRMGLLVPGASAARIGQLLGEFWLPLALKITEYQKQLHRPLIQGILGGQGTGKTTLAGALSLILNELGYGCASLSLDDLYKTYGDRQILRSQDSRFIRRGPPGTHDIYLGIRALQDCRQSLYPVNFPRFDKSLHQGEGDRISPELIPKADIIFFEGWFVGVRPIDPDQFQLAPSLLDTAADREFAQEINRRLCDYLPLWDCLDRLIILYPTDYRLSQQWRKQAEQDMKATGKLGMIDSEIDDFVAYFWRTLPPDLFVTPLTHNPQFTDLVIEINPDHSPGRIYQP